ncbi:heterokaryon incompatibility protein-domain-containing protein [Podospora aff. communis PSN243]|uniref:Heterokaryon incompatibility protein-domain-containing protein n=1 Tax=Podospora aff. communis PSN243 TaxID=3040156 RepID=A0AAV9GSY9_9PEZI|nr:heterokaryon incompatibility protein-domain-containing protein [Podospora aff. communis PSN243]
METYPYLPLRSEIAEIRLLSIGSVPSEDTPDECAVGSLKLTHASLDSNPRFAALSYVWGDPTDKQIIAIDGRRVAVTKNLYSAIAQLRRQCFTGYIWIDALCINQCDTAEKNSQVPLMARIYSQADNVLIWLGPESDGGALRAVQQLGVLFREQVRNHPASGAERIAAFAKTVRDYSITGTSPRTQSGFDFEAIWRFFRQRAWWRRVWIIQEVVLAQKATVFCTEDPSVTAPWEDVRECLQVFEWMILYPSTAPEHHRLYQILGDIYPNVLHLGAASDGYKRCLAPSATPVGRGEGGMSLMETITWTTFGDGSDNAIQATDSRDRIYGLLGMVCLKDRQRIPVDYSAKTTLATVQFAVAKVLLEDHGPDVLSFCRDTDLSPSGRPSWVPDWSLQGIPVIGTVTLSDNTEQKYNASNSMVWAEWASRARVENSSYQDPAISLPGAILGQIAEVGHIFCTEPTAPSFLADCRKWLAELRNLVAASPEHSREESRQRATTLENLWRVPIADVGLIRRPNGEDVATFSYQYGVLTGEHAPPAELDDEAQEAWVTAQTWEFRRPWKIYNRRAFVDADGRPGLGPKTMQPGDRIAVFAGAHVPFIIRRASDNRSRYRLVGSAYVYKLMDGEIGDASFSGIELI